MEGRRGRSGNCCFDEGTFTAAPNASVRLAFSLPSLVLGEIFDGLYGITPILPGRRGRTESSRIPGEGGCFDESAFIFRRAGALFLSKHS